MTPELTRVIDALTCRMCNGIGTLHSRYVSTYIRDAGHEWPHDIAITHLPCHQCLGTGCNPRFDYCNGDIIS